MSAGQGWIMLEASFPLALKSLVREFILPWFPARTRGISLFSQPLESIRSFISLMKVKFSKEVSRITQVLLLMSRHDNLFHVALEDGGLAAQNVGQEDPDYLKHTRLLTMAANSVGGTMVIPASQPNHQSFIFHATG